MEALRITPSVSKSTAIAGHRGNAEAPGTILTGIRPPGPNPEIQVGQCGPHSAALLLLVLKPASFKGY